MTIRSKSLAAFLILPTMIHCGPEASEEPELDPKETFSAFCERLFACPDVHALETYGSLEGCEDVHQADYEQRDRTCKDVVLLAEDCMTDLSCDELPGDCKNRLDEEGCDAL